MLTIGEREEIMLLKTRGEGVRHVGDGVDVADTLGKQHVSN